MSTITIQQLQTAPSIIDAAYIPIETAGITNNITALTLKSYMTTLPSLTVSGGISGTLTTAAQPNITLLGTLNGLTTSGQIVSTVATGTAPLYITSTTVVPNLYSARAVVADSTVNGLTTTSIFANATPSDATLGGSQGNLTMVLNTVNNNVGQWGGSAGGVYQIPTFTVNNKGLVTSASNLSVNLNLASQTITSLQGTANQITVSSPVGTSYLSLTDPVQVGNIAASGNVSGAQVYDNGNRVLTSVTAVAGNGISISGATTATSSALTIVNTGVTTLSVTGTGLALSGSTGNVQMTVTSVTGITTNPGLTASGTTGNIVIGPTSSSWNSYGARTVSTGTPSGGADGDIWYQV
jgi:hypothetical protein